MKCYLLFFWTVTLVVTQAGCELKGIGFPWRDLNEDNLKDGDLSQLDGDGVLYRTPSNSELILSSRANDVTIVPYGTKTDEGDFSQLPVNVRTLIDRVFASEKGSNVPKPVITRQELLERLPVIIKLLQFISGEDIPRDNGLYNNEQALNINQTWLCSNDGCADGDRRGKSVEFVERTTEATRFTKEAETVTSAAMSMSPDQRRFLGILLSRVSRDIEKELSTIATSEEPITEPSLGTPVVSVNGSEETRKNNPSIDEIITGIVQLLGGNVRVSKPPPGFRLRPSVTGNRRISSKRVNDRGPALFPISSSINPTPSSDLPSSTIFYPTFEIVDVGLETSESVTPQLESSIVVQPDSTTITTPLPETVKPTSTTNLASATEVRFVEVTDETTIVPISSVRIRIFSTPPSMIQPTVRVKSTIQSTDTTTLSVIITPTKTLEPSSASAEILQPTETSSTQDLATAVAFGETDIVYGKPANTDHVRAPGTVKPTKSVPETFTSKSVLPNDDITTLVGSGTLYKPLNKSFTLDPQSPTGRPYVVPVEIEEVRPFIGAYPNRPLPGNFGGNARKPPGPPPKDSYSGRPFPGGSPSNRPPAYPEYNRPPPSRPPVRKPQLPYSRPPIRPRPSPPLVRIDTCIVGDDSTCDVQLNERCLTELGVSSCHCRPGLARAIPRGPCNPVVAVSLAIKIDRIAERPVSFNKNYLDTSSDEYRIMEQETKLALNSLFSYTSFSRTFLGTTINKFHAAAGGLMVNTTIQLEENESNKHPVVQRLLQQEILNAITSRNLNIGDSNLYLNSPPRQGPLVQDLNECELVNANDCSVNGLCQNTFGSFRCTCKPGFMDKHPNENWKMGRECSVCSPTMCSNHGECIVNEGKRECKCRGNYIGTRCEIDGEVLGVALGASLAALVIIILTLICLCVWNRRWKRDQNKAAISPQYAYTLSKKNGPAPGATHVRVSVEDRMRWAHIADSMGNIYIQQHEGMPGSCMQGTSSPPALPPPPPPHSGPSSMKHIYATPSRLLLQKAHDEERNRLYGHVRPKSRTQLVVPAQSNGGYYDLNEYPSRDPYGSPHYGNPNISKPAIGYY